MADSVTLRGVQDPAPCLAGWRISSHFDEAERAALAWAESLTDVAHNHAPDDVFEPLKVHFTDSQISDLTFAISLMNAFNRWRSACGSRSF